MSSGSLMVATLPVTPTSTRLGRGAAADAEDANVDVDVTSAIQNMLN
jgi:hypothetical protein